ncbi:hypothetical protein [Streptomyces sp. cg36]|uniref:hypothetical protein n=1 Tax=Streptomyces sp. cg36 TaxID=3238798 RepID=UPI0034E20284
MNAEILNAFANKTAAIPDHGPVLSETAARLLAPYVTVTAHTDRRWTVTSLADGDSHTVTRKRTSAYYSTAWSSMAHVPGLDLAVLNTAVRMDAIDPHTGEQLRAELLDERAAA